MCPHSTPRYPVYPVASVHTVTWDSVNIIATHCHDHPGPQPNTNTSHLKLSWAANRAGNEGLQNFHSAFPAH